MVQMFYYENHGKCCKTLWKHDGKKLKVYLHAEESWAETASHSHWMVKSCWWRPKSRLVVEEVMGTKRRSGIAKMIDNGKGVLWIRGKFKDNLPNPYFRLTLSSHVSHEDFQLGYSMSGHVARSFEKYISYQITHLAFVRRRDFQQHQQQSTENNHPASINKSKTANFLKNLCRVYLTK